MDPDNVPPFQADELKYGIQTHAVEPGGVLCGRFLIEQVLSGPGVCEKYLAKDLEHLCRIVVVTTVTPPLTEDRKPSNTFQEICGVLIKLGHPHIETILETGKLFDGRAYSVAASTDLRPLSQPLGEIRRLVIDRAARVAESAAEALGAAHSRKILHCGLTPANILMAPDENGAGSVRLAGFGCAWPFPQHSNIWEDQQVCGSIFYTAPELLTGDRPTPASDIYSLAAVTWRMLTGEVPFKADDRDELLRLIAHGVIKRPTEMRTDLTADAESLLLSALQYKAANRPRDIRTFGRDLAQALCSPHVYPEPSPTTKAEVPIRTVPHLQNETASSPVVDERKRERLAVERPIAAAKPVPLVSDRAVTWTLIIMLLAGALSIPIGQTLLADEQVSPPVTSIVTRPAEVRTPREIKYSIGEENLNAGEFSLTFESDSPGNAYIFSESGDEHGNTVFRVLYPLAKLNGGSDAIQPGQQMKTRPAVIGQGPEPEFIWLVWTAGKQADLESVCSAALAADGAVRDEADVHKLKHFLERNKNKRLTVSKVGSASQTIVNGSGDRIVHRIELKHE